MTDLRMQAVDLRVGDRVRVETWNSLGRKRTWATVDSLDLGVHTVTVVDNRLGEFHFPRRDAVTVRVADSV